ncbi:MAG: glycosyltransferase family 39 protein, partial [Gemmatimonadota bacterium]|nr:glycosyltransferase family 39 protein [Gemmatimonadota bacterium]
MSTRWPARIVFGTAGTAGVLLVIVSLVVPTTAVAGGGRTLEAWWTAQFGLAICLAGVAAYPGWRRAALLGALFLLATGAQLALTSPLWLQYLELRPRMLVTGTRPVALAVLGLQGVTVLVGMRGRLRDLVAGVRRLMTVRVVMVAVLLLVLAGAHASIFYPHFPAPYYVAGYVAQLVAVGALFALNAVHLWLLARALPADVLSRLGERIGRAITLPGQVRPPTRIDRWVPWLLAAFVAVLSGWLAVTVFERVPHMEDEVAFIFQAKQLASFGLTGPAPPVPDAFMTYLLDTEAGRWFATTKPGWPLVLAIGVSAGAPWLVNPVLAAVCVLLLHALALRLTDRGTAHLVGLLGATSPWVLFLAASQMGHILPLLLTVGAFLLIHMAVERQRPFLALAAGLALGYGVLTRPLDGVVVGVLAGVYLLIESRVRWRLLIPFAVGCVGGSIGLLPYNAGVSGAPLRDPMMGYLDRLWYPGANRLGFGDDIGPPGGWGNLDPAPGHGLAEAVLNANQNLYNLNFELHGWALGSLLLIFAYLAFGRQSRLDRRLWVFCLALVATYSLYWFSG